MIVEELIRLLQLQPAHAEVYVYNRFGTLTEVPVTCVRDSTEKYVQTVCIEGEETRKMQYFLKAFYQTEEVEVTKEQFIHAERLAGFYPKDCSTAEARTRLATAGFSGNGVSGRVAYDTTQETV